jgi:hypothetical protein
VFADWIARHARTLSEPYSYSMGAIV